MWIDDLPPLLDIDAEPVQGCYRLSPTGNLSVHRVIIGDTPAKGLTDFDPILQLLWADGDGVECETVFVGAVARTVGRVLDTAGLAEGARCQGILVAFAQSSLFLAGAARTGDFDGHAEPPSRLDRYYGALVNTGRKIAKVFGHITG
jgi:hypothetical protein